MKVPVLFLLLILLPSTASAHGGIGIAMEGLLILFSIAILVLFVLVWFIKWYLIRKRKGSQKETYWLENKNIPTGIRLLSLFQFIASFLYAFIGLMFLLVVVVGKDLVGLGHIGFMSIFFSIGFNLVANGLIKRSITTGYYGGIVLSLICILNAIIYLSLYDRVEVFDLVSPLYGLLLIIFLLWKYRDYFVFEENAELAQENINQIWQNDSANALKVWLIIVLLIGLVGSYSYTYIYIQDYGEDYQEKQEQLEKERQKQAALRKRYPNGIPLPKMVDIPAGSFQMGSKMSIYEKPVHRVSIPAFKMASTETTWEQYQACIDFGPCSSDGDAGFGKAERPVINVSWGNAKIYIGWINEQTGKNYRLPSESEWEYAARAGSTTRFTWGNSCSRSQARLQARYRECGYDRKTVKVKSFKPNQFGLYDMHGNVREWTEDCWNDSYSGAPTDGSARTKGDCGRRVLRGRSRFNSPLTLLTGERGRDYFYTPNNGYGFRLVQDYQGQEKLEKEQEQLEKERQEKQEQLEKERQEKREQLEKERQKQAALRKRYPKGIPLPQMVGIPAGSFQMGSTERRSEKPVHLVSIPAFKMAQTETTWKQYQVCIDFGPCSSDGDEGYGKGNRPVINVNWKDAKLYIGWINEQTGKNYRLPSESEWEYAARAGSTTKYSWGNNISCSQARYGNLSGDCGNDRKTVKVKSFKPNQFGLYDMHGNVREWTEDCSNNSYSGAPTDGSARTKEDCGNRMLRGGSWRNEPPVLRSAHRDSYSPSRRYSHIGFRLVQD